MHNYSVWRIFNHSISHIQTDDIKVENRNRKDEIVYLTFLISD